MVRIETVAMASLEETDCPALQAGTGGTAVFQETRGSRESQDSQECRAHQDQGVGGSSIQGGATTTAPL